MIIATYIKFTVNTSKIEVCIGFFLGVPDNSMVPNLSFFPVELHLFWAAAGRLSPAMRHWGPAKPRCARWKLQMSANDISWYIHSIYIYILHIFTLYKSYYIYIHMFSLICRGVQFSNWRSPWILLGRCSACVLQSWPRCRRWWRMRRWVQKSQEALPKKI